MHVCFILDNSLPMLQKTVHSQLSLLDRLKNSMQSIFKSLLQGAYPKFNPTRDLIHLFTTSSTQPLSTHETCNQRHLIHQIKNLQTNVLTFPADVIESALYHVGKYRTLNQSQTLLGYRDGMVVEPAVVFYITTTVHRRHVQRLVDRLVAGKVHLRAEYKFITIRYCASPPEQATTLPPPTTLYQKSKSTIQKDPSTSMLRKLAKQTNGPLYCVYQDQQFVNIIQSTINKFTPALNIGLSVKEYRIYHKQLVKVRVGTGVSEEEYLTRVNSKGEQTPCPLLKQPDNPPQHPSFTITATPNPRQLIIPLPHDLTSRQLPDNKLIIDQLHSLKFCIDLSKQYIGETDPTMRVLFNTYQLMENKRLGYVVKDLVSVGGEKRFPVFYQRKKAQYLIGYMRLYWQVSSQSKNPRSCFQLHVSFSNFLNLNATIRSYRERHPSYQQFFQNYISTLPVFYHKFLHFYLPKLNIKLSPQTEQLFVNIQNTPEGVMNWKIYEETLKMKKLSTMEQKRNYEEHEKNTSTCCSVYSENFHEWEVARSKGDNDAQTSTSTLEQQFFVDNFEKLRKIKQVLGVDDYLLVKNEQSRPMRKQLQKYTVRRDDDEMDELMGDLLGNPFKKLNKKVKIHDQAESVWMDVDDLKQMKSLLQKQKQILESVKPVEQGDQVQSTQFIERNNIYDKAAWIKQKIVNTLKKNLDQETVEDKQPSKSQQRILIQQQKPFQYNQPITKPSLLTDNAQLVSQNQNLQINQKTDTIPQLIKSINSKFKTSKSVKVKIPAGLICCEAYDRNKRIIDEVIRSKGKLLK